MSYTTGTTHYNLPQTVGSDKRDWTDTNEAFSDVDAALWEAHQGATQAALDIASINSEIQTITGKQADDEADIATISGKVSTLETTVANHTTEIGDVRRDLQDNIESLREDTATSTHAYEIGDYFYYNDVLFKATAQIAIGATIVPNTNCTGVTVMDELKNGGAGSVAAADVTFDNTASGLTATDVQDAIEEVNSKIGSGSWTLLDSSTCATGISLADLPASAGELCILAIRGSTSIDGADAYILNIPKALIGTANRGFYFNTYSGAAIQGGLSVVNYVAADNKLTAVMYSGGSNASASSGFFVYYK